MFTRILLCASLGLPLLASALTPVSSPTPLEELQKSSEHKKVGQKIAECIEGYVNRDGQRDAEEELSEYLDKKWTKAAKGRSPLALSDDLAAALWYATDVSKVKGIKKGRVNDLLVPVPFYGEDYVSESAVWVPKKYSTKIKYPLILSIPAQGERPQDNLNEQWNDSTIRDNAIIVALGMPTTTENWGSLGEAGNPEKAGGIGVLLMNFRKALESYSIDYDRIYLAGHGIGVAAAMEIANYSPDRFGGVIGRTGDAAEISPDNLSNIPFIFAGGGKRATEFSEKAKEAGYADCTLQADAKAEHIWAWIEENSRRSNPEKIVLRPGSPYPNKAYWIDVPATEYSDDAMLTAVADRASNTITVDSTGIASIKLYFNDTIVDMDKPIKVICNGVENEDLVPRNFGTMMTLIYRSRSDPGKLYTAFRSYDIPLTEGEAKDAAAGPK